MNKPTKQPQPRYFEKPDENAKPVGFLGMLVIILSTHLGVRTRQQREDDFKRVNGLHVFIGGVVYFVIIIIGLIFLVRYLTSG
ncbi:MAG: hypothetical protein ACJA0N_002659 [Pseudohongiellaceae bacterium]